MPAVLRRDDIEVEALVIDRYVESLLAAHARQADDAPSTTDLDPALRATARRLSVDLGRVHPSFRFEDALSQQLAAVASGVAPAFSPTGGAGHAPAVPGPISIDAYRSGSADDAAFDHPGGPDPVSADRPGSPRPLLIGGAVASAALSIAGAAVIAWRLRMVDPATLERVARAAGRISGAALPQPRGRVH